MAAEEVGRWLRAMRRSGASWEDVVRAVLEEAQPPGDGSDPLLALAQAVSDVGLLEEYRGKPRCPQCHHPEAWHVGHPMSSTRRCVPPATKVVQTRNGTFKTVHATRGGGCGHGCQVQRDPASVAAAREQARQTGSIARSPRRTTS